MFKSIQWLQLGDNNSSFFHKKVASNWNHNKILSLVDHNGVLRTDKSEIHQEAIRYFEHLFQSDSDNYPGIDSLNQLISKKISSDQALQIMKRVTNEEILAILKSMKQNKSPRPDGFNVNFFIFSWDVIGEDFLRAVHHFMESGIMPHYTNATVIALIPKCQNPSSMTDFRPISCCNTVYKCISKIIATRLCQSLPSLIDKAQVAFVKGRSISDNILLAQEVFKGYSHCRGSPRAAFKMDISKAFYTCNWKFIFDVLILRGYPLIFIRWIDACITSAKFSIKINGENVGYFSSHRGLRQGDGLSPFLFVLLMDVLSEMFNSIGENPDFRYQHNMSKLALNHLCFADDLLLFCKGDQSSVQCLLNTLSLFTQFSGLNVNLTKSHFFLSNAPTGLHAWIERMHGLSFGSLPAKFLGVPLIANGLHAHHCHDLMDKITSRIDSWVANFLSSAGRLQLINFVLSGIHSYWCAHFMLPMAVIKQIVN